MKVNGIDVALDVVRTDKMCLREFLIAQGYNPGHVAVEHNGEVVPKSAFDQLLLSDSDILLIVRFVGGG
jgi:sulfur carrier protein